MSSSTACTVTPLPKVPSPPNNSFLPALVPAFLQQLSSPPYLYMGVATVLLLAGLLFLVFIRRARRCIPAFESRDGAIEVAPKTLRTVMRNAVHSVEGVERAHCRHFRHRDGIGVRVAIHLRASHPLREVENRIKQRIRASVSEQFGMAPIDPVHIKVTRIVGDTMAAIPTNSIAREEDSFEEGAERMPELEASAQEPFAEDNERRPS